MGASDDDRRDPDSTRERVRFFAGQVIEAEDLNQQQEYLRGRLRRHNLMLHGWGVVSGCLVTPSEQDWTVRIEPGYALDGRGDEIVVDGGEVDLSAHASRRRETV